VAAGQRHHRDAGTRRTLPVVARLPPARLLASTHTREQVSTNRRPYRGRKHGPANCGQGVPSGARSRSPSAPDPEATTAGALVSSHSTTPPCTCVSRSGSRRARRALADDGQQRCEHRVVAPRAAISFQVRSAHRGLRRSAGKAYMDPTPISCHSATAPTEAGLRPHSPPSAAKTRQVCPTLTQVRRSRVRLRNPPGGIFWPPLRGLGTPSRGELGKTEAVVRLADEDASPIGAEANLRDATPPREPQAQRSATPGRNGAARPVSRAAGRRRACRRPSSTTAPGILSRLSLSPWPTRLTAGSRYATGPVGGRDPPKRSG
jgi:hypothetical protein